ncbi:MAG: carboxylating nicotinate-nucleotide diphosphorylase [Acidimicrobiales bacterium]
MTTGIDCRPPHAAVVDVVTRALAEDMLPMGDLTAALVDSEAMGHFVVRARAEGVLAGLDCLIEAFAQIDPTVTVSPERSDGDRLGPGAVIATVSGPLRGILSAERTALNLISHLSGVASLARRYVDAVEAVSPETGVLDTRKTTPGLRALEKAAVRAGGGVNHRGSLSEAVLVKDNHLAGLGITEAVAKARRYWPGRMVEVECDRVDQVVEAVAAGATMVLLDNMGPEQVKECVAVARSGPASVPRSGRGRTRLHIGGSHYTFGPGARHRPGHPGARHRLGHPGARHRPGHGRMT